MKREIEFRGKTEDGRWIHGDFLHAWDSVMIQYEIVLNDENTYNAEDVNVDTVGQFTGFTDKNGTRIFEGDIVECCSWNEFFSDGAGKPLEPFRRKCVIEFRNGGFKMIEKRKFDYPGATPAVWDIIFNGDIVVIGNIYDNPELLED